MAVDAGACRFVLEQDDLLGLHKLALVAHRGAELIFLELLQLGLLEIATADTAVELNAHRRSVLTTHPRRPQTLKISGIHARRSGDRRGSECVTDAVHRQIARDVAA